MFNFLKSKEVRMRESANLVSNILLELKLLTVPDVSLDALDEIAFRRIKEAGAEPANLNYHPKWASVPFPATLCCSVDFEVCHAPPRGRTLKEGQIVKYDLGLRLNGAYADAAICVAVGEIDNRKQRAMRYGLQALYEGIKAVKANVPVSAIGRAIEDFAMRNGYNVIKSYGGHHIGLKAMHQEPHIPHHYDPKYDNIFLKEGDIICLEPMCTPGSGRTEVAKEDGWTVFTIDRQICVMFEHEILVTKEGSEILTKHVSLPMI